MQLSIGFYFKKTVQLLLGKYLICWGEIIKCKLKNNRKQGRLSSHDSVGLITCLYLSGATAFGRDS
jgi:hypothetical protein